MSTAQIWQTVSGSSDATLAIANQIGRNIRGGETIELVSDVGGGKTTFVHGLAEGMGSHDQVHSPSFTLSNEYQTDNLTLYHFDFYRLKEAGIMQAELAEILTDPKAVAVVEWAEVVESVLPTDRLTLRLRVVSETERQLAFEYPKDLSYLLPHNT